MTYDHVHIEERRRSSGGLHPVIIFYTDIGHNDRAHEIPLQAIGDRMELFGLSDELEALEFIGKEVRYPSDMDRMHDLVAPVYRAVVEEEGRVLVENNLTRFAQGQAQTVASCGGARAEVAGELDEARVQCRQRMDLGVHAPRPPRVAAQRDNCPKCRAKSATEIRATEQSVIEVSSYVDRNPQAVEAFRMLTAAQRSPHLNEAMHRADTRGRQ